MKRTRLVVSLLVLAPCAGAQIRHTSQAIADRFLLCARSVFHKPVYVTVAGPWFDTPMKCSSGREEILHELAERDVTIIEDESGVLLVPARFKPDIGLRHWRNFSILHSIANYDPLPAGSRRLSQREQDQIAPIVFEQALLPPLVPAFEEVSEAREMNVDLILDTHSLLPGTESVVGLFGAPGIGMRLVYGELAHGTYRILWDTPLFWGESPTLSYQDVDGDGKQEIAVQWMNMGGNVSYVALAIFNANGEELTRQRNCDLRPLVAESGQFACPIWGSSITFEKARSGRYDVVLVPNQQTDQLQRYSLVHGHYILLRNRSGVHSHR